MAAEKSDCGDVCLFELELIVRRRHFFSFSLFSRLFQSHQVEPLVRLFPWQQRHSAPERPGILRAAALMLSFSLRCQVSCNSFFFE